MILGFDSPVIYVLEAKASGYMLVARSQEVKVLWHVGKTIILNYRESNHKIETTILQRDTSESIRGFSKESY